MFLEGIHCLNLKLSETKFFVSLKFPGRMKAWRRRFFFILQALAPRIADRAQAGAHSAVGKEVLSHVELLIRNKRS